MNHRTRLSAAVLVIGGVLLMACNSQNNKKETVADKEKNRPTFFTSDDALFDFIQKSHLNYMWEGAEPTSGLAPERIHIDGNYPQNDAAVVTTGGSGFGLAGLIVGIERGFIPRAGGVARLRQITDYLATADRFHGVWPHWIDGPTGKTKAFSKKDNGGDLVESAFLMQGLLIVREYFKNGNEGEQALAAKIDTLWREMEWDWYLNGQNVLYWHWSPDYGWEMNFPLEGYNECLITYILAASSPTHPIPASAYHNGWARSGDIVSRNTAFGYPLILRHNGAEAYGGPLFWAHYSFIGLRPKGLSDRYADYWELNRNQTLINHAYCTQNPKGFKGYSDACWGLTASYSVKGYAGHRPMENDLGVIAPTAALSSFPYTPDESMKALRYFYCELGDSIWGKYGFYDAFSIEHNWYPKRYLAIDQLTIAPMIENHRSGLLWNLFMGAPEIRQGLDKLGFTYQP
ncbi:MAG: glucoamylase family protein [Proteiniphilum sp.]|nr:glucoamylase family protein [Proteiniphilum sp.]MDD4800011.1 glucoamylase family protein [Proteiniphilum sp.]